MQSEPWRVLAAFALARISMGFQFQTVPALAAPLRAELALELAVFGALVGIYLLPGAAAALAGGWLGQRIGDIRVAVGGLILMAGGGVAGAFAPSLETAFLARLAAGIGAVGLNVMLTKMTIDLFSGRKDLSAALSMLAAAWPGGIALAMVALPNIDRVWTLQMALLAPPALCILALVLVLAVWRRPAGTAAAVGGWPRGSDLAGVLHAGLIWAFFNLAFILPLTFGPGLLVDRGAEPVGAAASISLVTWTSILSASVGGWLVSRAAATDLLAYAAFLAGALLASFLAWGGTGEAVLLVGLGLVLGPTAGLLMTLPGEAAQPEDRATAMGIFVAEFYALMAVGPPFAGWLSDVAKSTAAPLWLAAFLLLACVPMFAGFRSRQKRRSKTIAVRVG